MYLICYAEPDYPGRAELLTQLESDAPVDRFVVCPSLEDLDENLLRPMCDVLAVVLIPADCDDLARILGLQEVLAGARIILILPTWDPNMLNKAHSLRPRFMTTREMDFREVGAVLRKIAKNLNHYNLLEPHRGEKEYVQ